MRMIKFILLLFVFICLSGCGREKYFVCKIDVDNTSQNYSLKSVYKIYYNDNYVTKIEKEDNYTSSDIDILNYFDEYKTLEYDNLNSLYGGFSYSINLGDDNVNLKSTINLKEVNIKKMLSDDYIDKDYIISNKLTTSGIKQLYKSRGAVCE